MGVTKINGSRRIQPATLSKDLLNVNFLNGSNLDLTNGSNDATLIGLADAVDNTSPATLGQVNTLISGLSGNLQLKGGLDASALGSQLDDAQAGWWYKVTVAGTIFGTNPIELAVGDNLYCQTTVVGTPNDGANFFKVDNTESPDLLRDGDVANNLTTTVAGSVLDATQGKILKDAQDVISQKVADLNTLTGLSANVTDFGTFTGSLIADNDTLKNILQTIETAVEAAKNKLKKKEYLAVTNGSAVVGNLTQTPTTRDGATIDVYLNGALMEEGVGNDYTISGQTITFNYNLSNVGQNVDKVAVMYYYEPA